MIVALATLLLLAAPAQAPAAADAELANAQALVQSVGARVEALRGLKFKRPVTVRLVEPAEARAYFLERARKLWPADKVRVDQAVYAQLGLVPPGGDLLGLFLDLLQEQARGYYDPGSDTFFVVRGANGEALPVVVAHELTHALDDQYFDLDALAEPAQDDDRSTALSALIEGSGTLVMSAFVLEEAQAGRLGLDALARIQAAEAQSNARLLAAPAYVQRTLLAPYALGMPFLLRGNLLGLATGVNAGDLQHAFEHPPLSTEQVLHPEKYWDPARRDEPWPVPLPDLKGALGQGFALDGEGSLGELGLAVLTGARLPDLKSVQLALPASWTNAAAEGLRGDRYQHYRSEADGAGLTLLATVWDGEDDAREFQAALVPVPGRRSYRYGSAVLLIGGASESQADALAPLALSALRAGDAR